MAKSPAKEKDEGERIPFDDALRQILKAPPHHRVAAKKSTKKKRK